MRAENSSLKQEVFELRQQLEEMSQYQGAQLPDLEGVRDRILASLKLGSSAPQYKTAKRLLDQFIKLLSSMEL